MEIYNEIKQEIENSFEKNYDVIITFMSTTLPIELIILKETPIELILSRIKYLIQLYNEIFDEKIEKLIFFIDCKNLTTTIYVRCYNER